VKGLLGLTVPSGVLIASTVRLLKLGSGTYSY